MRPKLPRGYPRRLGDLIGRVVRLKRGMRNSFNDIAAGSLLKVDRGSLAWTKLTLTGARCECCGVAARISHVSISDCELMPELEPLL